jgi:3-deoxy-D-manno-octulosonic-acid transferase
LPAGVNPAGLVLYRAATDALVPFAKRLLLARARRGKEDPARLGERLGRASQTRPAGPLLWLHGASIGEGLALLSLIERLRQRGFAILVTTGTSGAAAVLARRLPPDVRHQFVPLDAAAFLRQFLDHWAPQALLLAESEIWPNMVLEAARRGMTVAVVNGRISETSFVRWQRIPRSAATLFSQIGPCLAQTSDNAARFARLGAYGVSVGGNLKYDIAPPPADANVLAGLRAASGPRPVLLAASTHPGEEALLLAAHRRVAAGIGGLLTIIVPRDPRRGAEIEGLAREAGLRAARRQSGGGPTPAVDVFIADTFGEMGLWLRLASIVVIGKTFAGGGGQTPIEAARLGQPILHGPSTFQFAEIFAALEAAGASCRVEDAADLAARVTALMRDPARLRDMGRAGARCIEPFTGATARHVAALEPILALAQGRP